MLATIFDLATFTGSDVTDSDFAEAGTLALQLASGRVRRYTDQTLTEVVDDVVTLRGGGWYLALPQRPIIDLTVSLDGVAFTAWEVENDGLLLRTDGRCWPARVDITYTHGMDPVDDDIRRVVLQVAARNLANPAMMRSEAIDDYSFTTADGAVGGAQLTIAEMADLADYRVDMPSTVITLTGTDAS